MLRTKAPNTSGSLVSLIVVLVSIVLALVLVLNRQTIIDQLSVWQFKPSEEIVAFTDRTAMTERGEFLFYASQPSIEGTQVFNDKCGRIEQSSAILGCYDGRNIFVYDVKNAKLDGIREVTAAHEMLHAAYMRMNDSERSRINTLVEAEYAKLSSNQEFSERMAFYARTEPGERDNELHSIIGTEVASISPELERHYKTYFTDRSKVVALHTQYASVFYELQAKSKELSAELDRLADTIEAASSAYNQSTAQLNNDISNFNSRASGGSFSSQAQFNAERDALVARVANLEAQRSAINADRERYNDLREELVAIASESESLNRSIDSSLAPAPSL
ncbi:MAG TPA: hypothetical protein VF281_04795 [Candidatus Saccharimonadales bacterium]